ncbi:MAG: pilus assembly protein PilM [Actinomycetota bacterium]|nr:pilus assembly protein PilM [Actinomycetota bacterium]
MRRVVGIDIGAFSVKAVELEYDPGRKPTVSNFGLVTLPKGAVVGGEIRDRGAIMDAIRRIWSDGNFKSKDVCIGLSGSRVYLRDIEFPSMEEEDLLSSVRFEATTFLPGDTSEYEVDFEYPKGRRVVGEDGLLSVHLAATDNALLEDYKSVVQDAGLRLASVDASFLALVRAVILQEAQRAGEVSTANGRRKGTSVRVLEQAPEVAGGGEGEGGYEQTRAFPAAEAAAREKILAVVSVGADSINIGIAEDGMLTLARSIEDRSGDAITAAIASRFSLSEPEAESLKRSLGLFSPLPEELTSRVDRDELDRLVSARVGDISSSISTTLSSYLFQKENPAEVKVLVCGGGSLAFGFYDSLRQGLAPEIVLERLDLLELVDFSVPEMLALDKDRVTGVMPEALALALGRWIASGGSRVINLLGGEVEDARRVRRDLAAAGVSVFALLVVLGGLTALRSSQLRDVNNQVSSAQVQLSQEQAQLARLAPVAQVRTTLSKQEATLQALLVGDIQWPILVNSLDAATPPDVWWTSLSGQTASGTTPGTISFGGEGCSQKAPAHWLNDLATVPGLLDPWVSSSTASSGQLCANESTVDAPNNVVVSFSSTATLGSGVTPSRYQAYLTGEGISQ